MAASGTSSEVETGPCGRFRYQVFPIPINVGLVFLERKRPWPKCTNPETGNQWSDDMKQKIIDTLEQLQTKSISNTHNGETNNDLLPLRLFRGDLAMDGRKVDDDPSLRVAINKCYAAKSDVLLACQPVISDGRLAPVLAQEWGHSVVLWATPEQQTGEMISGNSLVGTHLMSANLRQLGFPIQLVYANLNWNLAECQLITGIWISFATRYLKNSKLGLIGYQAPGFQDFHPAHPSVMRKTFGPLLLHLSIPFDYLQTSDSITDEEISVDIDKMLSLFPLFKDQRLKDRSVLEISSRHYLTMKKLADIHNLDGIAIRCWPELPGPKASCGLDGWCYLALARLATEGFPISCEGDLDGVLGSTIAKFLGCGAVYLSDWLEHDETTLTLWHGGMAPLQLTEPFDSTYAKETSGTMAVSSHFNNGKPGCLDATIKIGMTVTVFRLWVQDNKYQMIALEGKTIRPKRHLLGNNGLVQFEKSNHGFFSNGITTTNEFNMVELFNDLIQQGFPHHLCVVEGKHAKRLSEFAKQTKNVNLVAIKCLHD